MHNNNNVPRHRSAGLIALGIAVVALIAIAIGWPALHRGGDKIADATLVAAAPAQFVGSEVCASCHSAETQQWRHSQHARAMQHATATTVLGNFNDAKFDYSGMRSRFFRQGDKFLVETDGADGKLTAFAVKYTFGVEPLQQYLVEFPDGRIQALPFAWDTRPANAGGQRWFHLYPREAIKHDDVLHWTRLYQNWNFMCAECHSTGVHKNYDADNDRFATTFAEISVGCEACHGQGSRHVAWAHASKADTQQKRNSDVDDGLLVHYDERRTAHWNIDAQTGNPRWQTTLPTLRKEVETCGRCHARREQISEDWVPGKSLFDTHLVSMLSQGLYEADGQMLDEVYNYGSFKQSKMFAAGVTCGNCHDAHSGKLRLDGDATCLQCHAANKYAAATHSHHEMTNTPPHCIDCHMPTRTYMGIDVRHDHSFRIPRPDLSAALHTPNTCNACHRDKTTSWANTAIQKWFGVQAKSFQTTGFQTTGFQTTGFQTTGFQNYGEAFAAARNESAQAENLLVQVAQNSATPAIARATALNAMAAYISPATLALARRSLQDVDPMVRIGAIDMLERAPTDRIWAIVAPLLSDPIRGVRIRAAALLAALPDANQPASDRAAFLSAANEYIAAQRLNADRPEARTALGDFYLRRGEIAAAETEYRAALRLSPQFAPAAVNLADLYRQLGSDSDGEKVLRTALAQAPRDAALHYALGLNFARTQRIDAAVTELALAMKWAPDSAAYTYAYAIALHSSGQRAAALKTLQSALQQHPDNIDLLTALVQFNRDANNIRAALQYAEQLQRVAPSAAIEQLISALRDKRP